MNTQLRMSLEREKATMLPRMNNLRLPRKQMLLVNQPARRRPLRDSSGLSSEEKG